MEWERPDTPTHLYKPLVAWIGFCCNGDGHRSDRELVSFMLISHLHNSYLDIWFVGPFFLKISWYTRGSHVGGKPSNDDTQPIGKTFYPAIIYSWNISQAITQKTDSDCSSLTDPVLPGLFFKNYCNKVSHWWDFWNCIFGSEILAM